MTYMHPIAFRIIALLLGCVLAFAPNAQAAERFTVAVDRLIFDAENGDDFGDIDDDDLTRMIALLRANPSIRTLQLNSSGGDYYAAIDLSEAVIDFELDTHVDGVCESSCVMIFLGGKKRTMARGSKIGFHQKSWSPDSIQNYYEARKDGFGWQSEFDYASWIYEDTQQETYLELVYMIERGVRAEFAVETIKSQGDGIWHPYRAVLLAAGVLTE